jgi:uncharacterized membrane protein
LANWAIFLDHIPHEVLSWTTIKHYGFSDAADQFVFISGYTAALVSGRLMIERGYVAAASRLARRAFTLYAAHITVVMIYIAVIAYASREFHDPDDLNQFNVAVFLNTPFRDFVQALALRYRPVNLDVLPLYILLLAAFAPVLWLMVRKPNLTLAGSIAVYLAGRHLGWNLAAVPSGVWYFNPFAWQLLFFLGAWTALGGARALRPISQTRTVFWLAIAALVFSSVVTMAIRTPDLGGLVPHWILQPFDPNDKTNLAPYRIAHFIALAVVVTRFLPVDSPILQWRSLAPLIQMRPELASGLLHRHRAVVLRPCRNRTKLELPVGSDSRRCDGNSAHDCDRILLDVAQTAESHASFACATRRHRVTSNLALVWPAVTAAFLASLVEAVEALTIVLAVAIVRGWRPAGLGALAGLAVLALIVIALGPLLDLVPLRLLQLFIGILLLLFGMRWLRKAILRAAGVIPLHDEAAAFATETAELREQARRNEARLDWIGALTTFKAVLLEGLEVVFIVIALGAGRGMLVPASVGAVAACLAVAAVGLIVHRPLARVPENTLKFAVGIMLSAFGVFWTGEGLGVAWPGADFAIVIFAAIFLAVSVAAVALARRPKAEALS